MYELNTSSLANGSYGVAKLFDKINHEVSNLYDRIKVSFEFFPPKNETAANNLWKAIDKLSVLQPDFVSITYGALASSRDLTHDLIEAVQQRTNLVAVPHLTCVNASEGELRDIAQRYWDIGVRHIVALRGDVDQAENATLPADKQCNSYAVDLVRVLKDVNDFEISVAAYPEVHPEAPSAQFDLDNLKAKFDAGASRAITQFFFNNENFLRFRDQAAARGISGPIVPGILPVSNYQKLLKFTEFANVNVPDWMHNLYQDTDKDPLLCKLLGINIALEQIKVLTEQGVDHFHFYTLNRSDLTYSLCHYLGARDQKSKTIAA
ncbi:MAG: methylenetetrahydrofolate reductase [Gammaproteobacteria bacterium]|nr:methylenetetrahydrofolate reductase [Gammaproteobacteria bacterium]